MINRMISKELLAILACPVCKRMLGTDAGHSALLCLPCAMTFPLRDDIPIMLFDEAERVS